MARRLSSEWHLTDPTILTFRRILRDPAVIVAAKDRIFRIDQRLWLVV